jgi:photosystem II stability/assembly factor-like uncharacterized protein
MFDATSVVDKPPVGLTDAVKWRLIGPIRGGRVVAVAGDPTNTRRFYFGSTGGGVWRTDDGAITWTNVSDGFFKRASVGALVVAQADTNVVYAGMGECCIRNNVSHGDGVYRSDDGGRSWSHRGLAATRHIGRLRVHPQDADTVYVAALGHAHGPNAERGVYRTRDGGRSWELVLHIGTEAGAVDLALDPTNPRVLFASFWQTRRLPWTLESGGPASGIWRSTDGGETWTDITRRPGLPNGILGRIGLTGSAAVPGRVWATVEARDGAIFRSDDLGDHWLRLSEQDELRLRPFYYQHVFADPVDGDTVWALNINVWRSTNGGSSFTKVSVPHGDAHDLWIDPSDPNRVILGSDGGANVSFDGGRSWSSCYNQPTAELYHVTADNRVPYRVYAAQQDYSTVSIPSHSDLGAITQVETYPVGGGETGYIAIRPDDPEVVFAGNYMGQITRFHRPTGTTRWIPVWPEPTWGEGAQAAKYRFAWTSPIVVSAHDSNCLYHGGNRLFKSIDEGFSWNAISPDLTRNDPSKLQSSGGELTPDNSGAEYYCTIFALAESPVQAGVLWVGSDDGLVHVTRDEGANWTNVTPPDLPEWAAISGIEASHHDVRTAYVVAERHKLDDFQPYLWRTNDFGATWTRLDAGLPGEEFCRVIREDPARASLLYCGTEAGIYASFDLGATWRSLRGNLPVTPVHDLIVRGGDLIAATHGRSIWIQDDLDALRQYDPAQEQCDIYLYRPRTWIRYTTRPIVESSAPIGRHYGHVGVAIMPYESRYQAGNDDPQIALLDAGENSPNGATILYWLKDRKDHDLQLTVQDSTGATVRTFSAKPASSTSERDADTGRKLPRLQGLNRFVWDGRHDPGTAIEVDPPKDFDHIGPLVPPGLYEVSLRIADQVASVSLEIAKDPRNASTAEDFEAQYRLTHHIWRRLCDLNAAVNTIRRLRAQLNVWSGDQGKTTSSGEIEAAAAVLLQDLIRIEKELITSPDAPPAEKPSPKLVGKLSTILQVAELPYRPTPALVEVADELSNRLDAQIHRLQSLVTGPLQALNELITRSGLKAISTETLVESEPTQLVSPSPGPEDPPKEQES